MDASAIASEAKIGNRDVTLYRSFLGNKMKSLNPRKIADRVLKATKAPRWIAVLALILFRARRPTLPVDRGPAPAGPTLWIDVTRSSQSSRVTGIERVTRELSREIMRLSADGMVPRVAFFSINSFGDTQEIPSAWLSDTDAVEPSSSQAEVVFRAGDTILLLDLSLPPSGFNRKDMEYLRAHGVSLITTVYDVLPVTRPELFSPRKSVIFREWLLQTEEADKLLFISGHTRHEYLRACSTHGVSPTRDQTIVPLGATHYPPLKTERAPRRATNRRDALAVGTLEPRKDYDGLLEAMEIIWSLHPSFTLTIVGRPGWRCKHLVSKIKNHPRLGRQLHWEANAGDSHLQELFTTHQILIANSIDEGFGLPLIEAEALGVTVVARDIPVFREVLPSARFFASGDQDALASCAINAITDAPEESSTARTSCSPRDWRDGALAVWEAVRPT